MDTKYLAHLSLSIGKEWSLLAYDLGFADAQVDHIRSSYPHNIQQCISSMLIKWHETTLKYNLDPLPLLTRSLTSVDRYDLVQKINCDFDEPDKGSQENGHGDNLCTFNAALKQVHFGQTQNDMQMYLDQTERFLEYRAKDRRQFVNTKATHAAFDILTSHGTLMLIGNPGDGKSTIAINLLIRLRNEGATVIVLSDPSLIERIYDDEKQIVYFVDDAFGTPTVNMRLVETWTRLHAKIESLVKLEKCKLLITTRKHVYMKCHSCLYSCPSYQENIIDLTGERYRLSIIDKNRIVAKYCEEHGLFPTQLNFSKSAPYVPGFPLLCKMFANDKRMQEVEEFFEQTLSVLHKQLRLLADREAHSFCGLVLIMMFDGSLPRAVFDPFELELCSEQERTKIQTIMRVYGVSESGRCGIEKNLDEMVGVYVEEIEEHFKFIHDAIFDTVCLVFGTKYPNEVIRVSSSVFIEKRIRTENIPDASRDTLDDVIVLKKSKYHILAQRWLTDAIRGNVRSMFINPSISDLDMQTALVDRVIKLNNQGVYDLLNCVGKLSSQTVLFQACKRGIGSLVNVLLEKLQFLKDNKFPNAENLKIDDTCLIETVSQTHIDVVDVLLRHGAMVNAACAPMCFRSIHIACKKGSLDIVQLLIQYGADIGIQDFNGKRAIHYACEFGRLDILKELYVNGSSLSVTDVTGKQSIHYACMSGSLPCVQFLQEKGVNIGVSDNMDKTALHYAAGTHSPDLLRHIVASGTDVNVPDSMGGSPLHFACKVNVSENVEILLKHGADISVVDAALCSPLHLVCKGGGCNQSGQDSFKCVQLLLEEKPDVNDVDCRGKTALHYACAWARDRRLESVNLLLMRGADPNIVDDYGHQPVFYACESGNLKCLQALVKYGIDVNQSGHQGRHPIHYACGKGTVEVARMLVDKGAAVSCTDSKGKQPLHYASQYGNDGCLRFLLALDVDVNCADDTGFRPLHYACKWCRPNAVRILLKYGAEPEEVDSENRKPDDLVPKWSSRKSQIKRFLRGHSLNTM